MNNRTWFILLDFIVTESTLQGFTTGKLLRNELEIQTLPRIHLLHVSTYPLRHCLAISGNIHVQCTMLSSTSAGIRRSAGWNQDIRQQQGSGCGHQRPQGNDVVRHLNVKHLQNPTDNLQRQVHPLRQVVRHIPQGLRDVGS